MVLSPGALAEFEDKLDGLPADYREFIAVHNGVRLCGTSSLQGPGKVIHWMLGMRTTRQIPYRLVMMVPPILT